MINPNYNSKQKVYKQILSGDFNPRQDKILLNISVLNITALSSDSEDKKYQPTLNMYLQQLRKVVSSGQLKTEDY